MSDHENVVWQTVNFIFVLTSALSQVMATLQGRVGILRVHARGKKIEPGLDFDKVARATAGFTGADLMNLMNQSAITAVRAVRHMPSRAASMLRKGDVLGGKQIQESAYAADTMSYGMVG